ncbi:hypothetical protein Hanom_Chr06g00546311 [Helianthus anomalus]
MWAAHNNLILVLWIHVLTLIMMVMIKPENMHSYIHNSKNKYKNLTLSLFPSSSRPNTPSHFNISFSKPKYEESRANHGDSTLVRRFGSDFKQNQVSYHHLLSKIQLNS